MIKPYYKEGILMRTEMEALVHDIEEGITLLRRHL
jgi:hypothetical protein